MKNDNLKAICSQIFADYPDIVTVKQVREMLGASRTFVYELINNGDLPAMKICNTYRIPKVYVIQYLVDQKKIV